MGFFWGNSDSIIPGVTSANVIPPPPPSTLGPHPRVWMDAPTLAQLQLQRTNNTSRWQNSKANADAQVAKGSSYSANDEVYLGVLGELYLATGNANYATRAGILLDNYCVPSRTLNPDGNYFDYRYGLNLATVGLDWCYNGLTLAQQQNAGTWLMNRADVVWPDSNPPRISGHGVSDPTNNYFWGFMQTGPAAIVADGCDTGTGSYSGSNRPLFHRNLIVNKWNNMCVPLFFRGAPLSAGGNGLGAMGGGAFPEGSYYDSAWAVAKVALGYKSAGMPLSTSWIDTAITWHLQESMPGLKYKLNFGDQPRESTGLIFTYDRMAILALMQLSSNLALKQLCQYWLNQVGQVPTTESTLGQTIVLCQELLWYDPAQPAASDLSSLTLDYEAYGTGAVLYRKSWTDDQTSMTFVGNADGSQGHMSKSGGQLLIWSHGGWLLPNANMYSASGIVQTSDAFNCMATTDSPRTDHTEQLGQTGDPYLVPPQISSSLVVTRTQGKDFFTDVSHNVPWVSNYIRSVVYLPVLELYIIVDDMTTLNANSPKIIYWQAHQAAPVISGQNFTITNPAGTCHLYGQTNYPTSGLGLADYPQPRGSGGAISSHTIKVSIPVGTAHQVIVSTLQISTAASAPHTIGTPTDDGTNVTVVIDGTTTVTIPLNGTSNVTVV